ncbi:hypothetical protein MTQ01_21940 [Streptomyces sp. XM4193]|uniref:hypothetical protein n=1 Tax=Streptomyces sp. XM4193 TaxID=2929782 RepID=UPI001FF97152|nr:hypothetical protein [Streptomyces sp. XM4193]MCK1798637.1 hypothetical protein [Streptomyces sp. XM4193]
MSKGTPRRRRYVLWSVLGAMTVTGGVVGYALATREEPPKCDRLMANDQVRKLLGNRYESGMGCAEFGTELRAALTGKEPGRHTAEQARTMRAVVTEISQDVYERGEARIHKELRQPVAGALADYAEDVYDVMNQHTLGDRGATDEVEDGRVRAALPRMAVGRTLLAVSEDPAAHGLLFAAMAQRCAQQLATVDRKKAEAVEADGQLAARAVVGFCGWAMGWILRSADEQEARLDSDSSKLEAWNQVVVDTMTKPDRAVPPFNRSAAAHVFGTWKQDLAERPRDQDHDGHAKDLVTIWVSALGFEEGHEVANGLRREAMQSTRGGSDHLSYMAADCLNGKRTC